MNHWIATLVHNLAVAGFGALMFHAGDNFGFHMGADESQCTCQWAPGRGGPYRAPSWCEQDAADDDVFWREEAVDFDDIDALDEDHAT